MFKKVIISCMLTSMCASWGYATYRYFTPEVAPLIYQSALLEVPQENNVVAMPAPVTSVVASVMVAPEDGEEVAESPSRRVVYYCNQDNQDCGYLESQVIAQINLQLGHSLFDTVEYIDPTKLDVQSSNKRKSEYGFANYPAVVIYDLDETGASVTVDCLQYEASAPWTVEQLSGWLIEHEVITFE